MTLEESAIRYADSPHDVIGTPRPVIYIERHLIKKWHKVVKTSENLLNQLYFKNLIHKKA